METALNRQQVLLAHVVPATDSRLALQEVKGGDEKVLFSVEGEIALLTINNPPVNSFHPSVGAAFGEAYKKATQDNRVKAIVIVGNKGQFMAGADIAYINEAAATSDEAIRQYIQSGLAFVNAMEDGVLPVVAAIDGFALGGGLELAMSCHARVATAKAQLGLPELTLGLIPGLGGTQRLPRLVGTQKALEMMLKSQNVKAPEGKKLGLVDEVVENSAQLLPKAFEVARELVAGRRPLIRTLSYGDRLEPFEQRQQIIEMARQMVAKMPVPHPKACVEATAAGVLFDSGLAGLREESAQFFGVVTKETAKSMIHLFFAKRACTKVPGVTGNSNLTPRTIRKFGVVGGGLMGSGIATAILLAGGSVVLKEVNQKFLDGAVSRITGNLQSRVKRGALTPALSEKMLSNLKPSLQYSDFRDVHCVIEAVFEDLDLKQKVFADIEANTSAECILASNTSTINIDLVAAKTKSQDRFVGLHFFSPAHVMPLLEIVRTAKVAPQIILDSLAIAAFLRKTPIVVGNCPGFTVNRIFFPFFQAAALLVDLGADPYHIDRVLMKFGLPMGAFRLSDLVGLDIQEHVSANFFAAFPDRTYDTLLFRRLVASKRLGEKTKAGVYRYDSGKALPDPELAAFLTESRQKAAFPASTFTDEEIVQLVLLPVVNECTRVLEEGMVLRASDIDLGSVLGYSFPPYRGGVMKWASTIPTPVIVARLNAAYAKYKVGFFKPSAYLVARAQTNAPLV